MTRAALPLADAAELRGAARRTALLRSGLAAALLVLVAAAFAAAPGGGSARATATATRGAVVILDVSGSIDDRGSAEIQRTLAALIRRAGPGGRFGLVLFSDVSMEALPPTAPTAALQAFRRFFIAIRSPGRKQEPGAGSPFSPVGSYGTSQRTLSYPTSPWGVSFSGGTAISSGLREAREDLARAHLRGGTVVLLSDLVDAPQDLPALKRELRRYAADPSLDLRVRALSSDLPQRLSLYRRFLGPGAVTSAAAAGRPVSLRAADGWRFPIWLVALVGAGALLLAANELLSVPLDWRPAKART